MFFGNNFQNRLKGDGRRGCANLPTAIHAVAGSNRTVHVYWRRKTASFFIILPKREE